VPAVFDSAFINENGALTFGSGDRWLITSVASLAALGIPVIAPTTPSASTALTAASLPVKTARSYSRGIAGPRPGISSSYVATDAGWAFHAWAGPTVNGATAFKVFADVVLCFGSGNFSIQLVAGSGNPDIPALGGVAGFAMGSNVLNLTGPRSGNDDLYYEFQNGALVPAPATAPLLLTALAALLSRCPRKRKPGRSPQS
jgi:hypothetical protein